MSLSNDQIEELNKEELVEEIKKNKKPKRTKEEYLKELADKRRFKEEEKERNRIERELLKKQKDKEKKIKKEEEQLKKEEERVKREEERKLKKQEELQKKEYEKVKKEEEKRVKKELDFEMKIKEEKEKEENLSKLRISNFFKKKTEINESNSKLINTNTKTDGSASRSINSLSIKKQPITNDTDTKESYCLQTKISEKCPFDRKFQPFYLKTNHDLYQLNVQPRVSEIDDILFGQLSLEDNKSFFEKTKESYSELHNFKQKYIANRVPYMPQDNSLVVFHECDRGDKTDEEINDLLSRVPHKYLKFYENTTLPFTGTYSETAVLSPNNPFDCTTVDFEYDKDSDFDDYGYIDSDEDVSNELEDGEEGEELDSDEDDDDDEDEDDYEESNNEFSEFVEVDANTTSVKENNRRKKKTLLIPVIQYSQYEPQVSLDAVTLSLFNDADKAYMESISIKMLYPTPINVNEPIGASADIESESKKRTIDQVNKDLTEEVIVENTNKEEKENSSEPESKKVKTVISDLKALIKILEMVDGCPYSKNTLVEVLGFALDSKFSRKLIKDTVDHYALREKDKWMLKDTDITEKLAQRFTESQKDIINIGGI
ncbi:hypothetical protein QEN19_001718 [Hanseniaspora menglaensis]